MALMWSPLSGLPQSWALSVTSVLFGIGMVFIYGYVSNQKAIRRVKNEIGSHLLETYLFRYDTILSLKAQLRLFIAGARYFIIALAPMCILALPCVLLLAHLNLRLGYRPLQVGEERILKVTFSDSVDLRSVSLTSESLRVAGPVRSPKEHVASYRVAAPSAGVHTVALAGGFKEQLVVGRGQDVTTTPLGIFLTKRDWISALFYPNGGGNQYIQSQEVVQAVFQYPEAVYSFFGVEMSWVFPFLVISLLSGYVFSKFLGVAV